MTKLLTGAALALLATTSANAVTINGTAAVAVVGVSSSTASIGLGTTFTNTLFSIIGSGTGDLSGTAGVFLTLSPMMATVGTPISFTSSIGNFSGLVNVATAGGPITNRIVDLYALGTFSPLGSLSAFDPGAMSLTFSATQTGGPGSSVSSSFTLASPPAPPPGDVPAPAAIALFGLGVAALGLARRAR